MTGEIDQINSPTTQVAVQEALSANVITLTHSKGHLVPTQNGSAIEQMVEWIAVSNLNVSAEKATAKELL